MIFFKTILVFISLQICLSTTFFAQPVITNTYRFYNNLATTEQNCAEDLIPTKGLNNICNPLTASTSGIFITDSINNSGIARTVYHNNLNWGLKYLNTTGVIKKTYTIHIYVKVTNFHKDYTRILDFSNGVEDNGIYFTKLGYTPAGVQRCLNFYPSGNFGTCPFFNNSTYYLLTFTRNDVTKKIDIYVNDQLFTSYNDAASFYVSDVGKPIHLFRDDPVGYDCEDGEANFAYVSFSNAFATQADVSTVYNNIFNTANTTNFSSSTNTTCVNNTVQFNYTGTATYNPSSTWNWDGGTVTSGTGQGPYTVTWNTSGIKNISLSVPNACNTNMSIHKVAINIIPNFTTLIDTTICSGNSAYGYNQAGTYIDTLTAANGCKEIRKLTITIAPTPQPNLLPLYKMCKNDFIKLYPGSFKNYIWQNGSTDSVFTATQAGVYNVTVSNGCATQSVQTVVETDDCSVFFPTIFTPNNDGKNDVFKCLTTVQQFNYYNLKVFNRYGQVVFSTTNAQEAWNGILNGKLLANGAYAWYCSYKRNNTNSITQQKGTIVLLR